MKRPFFRYTLHGASSAARRMTLTLAAAVALAATSSSTPFAGDAKRLNVLELFTSQGCSSCPPADKLLGELSKRDNVLALSFPVSYWDNLGWKDTLAKESYNERQRNYAEARGDRQIYTPQLVVNGMTHAVGSRRADIEAAMATTDESLRDISVPVSATSSGNVVQVDAGAAPEGSKARSAKVWLAFYNKAVSVNIGRGENHGRKVTYTNVVRELKMAGEWAGQPSHYSIEIPHGIAADGCAVLLQSDNNHAMLGAADMAVRSK